ncbi:phage holin family protein [Sporosarcina sp. G11-34]|uniref:phage holin family protein n=1 Tax=Sporosarcina sp. G11-34 TaxID=2849605 RepID=UPI0022A928AC|nr:phage holin family protein [Sporosarcina sp. G11-34]MCZ2258354.1 phage holin family protein [Sporosarcina sp. G11-34]
MEWFGRILLNAVFFLLLSLLIPSFTVVGVGNAILASILLALVNMLVRPLLILFTLPATILTLGLFLFVINALMLLLTNKLMGEGFIIDGFGTALLIAILMSILNLFLNSSNSKRENRRRR